MGDRDEVAELRRQVAALVDRVAELEARLDEPPAAPEADPVLAVVPSGHRSPSPTEDPDDRADHPAGSSRRQLLRAVGAAAAGAVGGTVALASATAGPAAAADGANIQVGESQSGTGANSVTDLNNSTFRVTGGPTSALYGIQSKTNTPAITGYGQGTGGDGVRGFASDTGSGVSAESAKGHGISTETSASGKAALFANTVAAGAIGVQARSAQGPAIQLQPGPSMPPFTGTWTAGALVVSNGQLWYCWAGGTGEASKWCRLSSTFTALAGSRRVYDSRPDTQPPVGTKTRFSDHTTRVIDAKFGGAIIPGASAVLLNVVATETNAAGYFSFWRNGTQWPGTSSINWNRPDTTIANSVVTSLDANGLFQARMEGAGGAHLVVDVVGFYL